MTPIAPPRLRWVAHATLEVGAPIVLDQRWGGCRLVPVRAGRVIGEWRGIVLEGGADRQNIHEDGSVTLDARYPVLFDDGSTVQFIARGSRLAGAPDGAFRTSLILQGDIPPDIGATVYVAVGRKAADTVEFDIFEVA